MTKGHLLLFNMETTVQTGSSLNMGAVVYALAC